MVSGLYTMNPGCISIAILTPWSAACLPASFQYGVATLSHCHSRTSRYSGGHGQVTQFGYFALSLSPGQPEKSITTGTPSFSARRIVRFEVSWYPLATFASGCSGLPWELSALILNPLSSRTFFHSFSSFSLSSIESLQWGSPG